MIYCKKCILEAKSTDTACPTCGGPLAVVAAASPAKTPPPPGPAPSGESGGGVPQAGVNLPPGGTIAEILDRVERNRRRTRWFRGLSLAVAVAIVVASFQIYARTVLDFALLERVRLLQDPDDGRKIHVFCNVVRPGKVISELQSGGQRKQMVYLLRESGDSYFYWRGLSDPATGVEFRLLYRTGLLPGSSGQGFVRTSANP